MYQGQQGSSGWDVPHSQTTAQDLFPSADTSKWIGSIGIVKRPHLLFGRQCHGFQSPFLCIQVPPQNVLRSTSGIGPSCREGTK